MDQSTLALTSRPRGQSEIVARFENRMHKIESATYLTIGQYIPIDMRDRAIGFFRMNYVEGAHGPRGSRIDQTVDVYESPSLEKSPGLLAAMDAVGAFSLAQSFKTRILINRARAQYAKALQFTNEALKSPTEATKDDTLAAIVVLGMFEVIAAIDDQSNEAQDAHVMGAGALIALRGPQQLKSPRGRRLFMQVITHLITISIRSGVRLPQHISDMLREPPTDHDKSDPTWAIQKTLVEFTHFYGDVRDRACTNSHVMFERAKYFNTALDGLEIKMATKWGFDIIVNPDKAHPSIGPYYHWYESPWVARFWNTTRIVRMMVNLIIRMSLVAGSSTPNPILVGLQYQEQLKASTVILYKMQSDILASVPQALGKIFGLEASPIGSMKSSNVDPIVRASTGLFLLWPLAFVGLRGPGPDEIRLQALNYIQIIGDVTGIQRAYIIARSIKELLMNSLESKA